MVGTEEKTSEPSVATSYLNSTQENLRAFESEYNEEPKINSKSGL